MNKKDIFKNSQNRIVFLWTIIGIAMLMTFVVLTFFAVYKLGGLCLAFFWFALAMLVRSNDFTKNFSYTLIVVACVTTSMYFPDFYLHVGNINTMAFIIPILQFIMFGMGTQLSLRDFQGILKQPYGVFAGLLCQFSIMPLVGFTIATTFGFEPEIAAGIILVGCVPCGIASNVMNFIAKSNMALSVTLTAVATLLAPLLTPLFMKILAGQLVEIQYLKMTAEITNLVILPILGGIMFQTLVAKILNVRSISIHFVSFALCIVVVNGLFGVLGQFPVAEIPQRSMMSCGIFLLLPIVAALLLRHFILNRPILFDKILSLVSMIGLLLTIVIINAAGRDYLLKIGFLLIFACLLHNLLGFFFGYWVARIMGLDERSCRTISIEVGLQNGGLASGLALQMGKVATVGLAPAVFGPLMNITGSSLATWWRGQPLPNPNSNSQENTTK
jgi:BASS family bile acid:Na+ symporter